MENISLSVTLSSRCCNRNYFMKRVVGSVVWFRGRKYHWETTGSEVRYNLYCNNRLIGDMYIDEVIIYDEYLHIIRTWEELLSLIAMFNLYPY